jgi:5-methyltetrahydrofolate--homocysteine methyltransferase
MFTVIAERINATRPRIATALLKRDDRALAREVRAQEQAGASFIDVNAGRDPAREMEDLEWAVGVVKQNTSLPLCLDSANALVLRRGLELVKDRTVMLNSVTGEQEKMKQVLPLAAESGALLVALAMDERGLPDTAERRVEVALKVVTAADEAGIRRERLYIDPCIQPISTSPSQAAAVLESIPRIMKALPAVHTTCGLSNISFGLPNRNLLNCVYLGCMIMAGLDSAIIDPTAEGMMDAVRAAEALAGRDEWCMDYIRAMRAKKA